MREMKDSGIEWAGQIPNNWDINKGKYFMNLLIRPTLDTDEVITCFRDGEVTLRSKRREEGFTISLTEAGYQGIEIGDLVVHGMDGFAGSIGISDSRGKATPIVHNITMQQLQEKYPNVADIHAIDSSMYNCDQIALLFAKQLIKRLKFN